MHGLISGLFILFHWFVFLLLGQYHTVWITVALSERSFVPEQAMATHSSTLAWKIPWTEEPGRLQSLGS